MKKRVLKIEDDKTRSSLTVVAMEFQSLDELLNSVKKIIQDKIEGNDVCPACGKVHQAPEPTECSECGKMKDCRDIGSKGAEICFECAYNDKNRDRSRHNMDIRRGEKEGELQ